MAQIIILGIFAVLVILVIILLFVIKLLFSDNIKSANFNIKILKLIKFNFSVSYFNE